MKNLFIPLPALLLVTQAVAQEKVLSEITVSAEGSDIAERRASATQKTILDKKAIEDTGGLYVGEVLSKLPGVDAGVPSSDGTVALRSRGMVRDSVQVLVDGERPPGDARHALMIVARMPAGELERVEIIKGASAEYGSATPVVVNLVTTRAKRKDSTNFKLAAGFKGSEPVTQMNLTKGGSSGPWSWTVPLSISDNRSPIERTLSRSDSTGTNQKETEKGGNEIKELFFGPKLNWKDGSDSFSIWPMLFLAQGERTTNLVRSDENTGTTILRRNDREESFRRANRIRFEGETLSDGNKWSGRLTMVNSQRNSDVLRDGTSGRSTEEIKRDENEINAGIRMDRGWGDHVSAFGLEQIDFSRTENQNFGGTYVANDLFHVKERQNVAWLQDEWSLSKDFSMTSGLRNEAITLEADSRSSSHGLLSPSVAARWEFIDSWVFRSSLGTGIKAPKLEEITNAPIRSTSANNPLEPDRRGNPDVRPEKSVNLEFALEHYWPEEIAVVGTNLYFRETEDFIERRSTQESGRWVERPYNEGTAKHTGFEVDGKIKTDQMGLKGGSFRSHLTLPHARVEDSRLGITRNAREVPAYIWTFGYDQSLPKLTSNAGFLLQQTGKTKTDVAGEQWAETKSRSVLDAYWVRKVTPTVNLRLTLQNILGEDTRRTVRAYSGGQDWQLGSLDKLPRSFLLTLEGKW